MTDSPSLCPMCEEGPLRPSTYTGRLEHDGQTLLVADLECHVCDVCGADPVLEDQARRNQRRYADARRRSDGLLTGDEIRHIRDSLGLTQHEAARIFGGGANAFSKYERGDVVQSVAMDRLIRMVAAHPQLLDWLKNEAALNTPVDAEYS